MVANSESGDPPPDYINPRQTSRPRNDAGGNRGGHQWVSDEEFLSSESNVKNKDHVTPKNSNWMNGASAGVKQGSDKLSHTAVFVAPDSSLQEKKTPKKW